MLYLRHTRLRRRTSFFIGARLRFAPAANVSRCASLHNYVGCPSSVKCHIFSTIPNNHASSFHDHFLALTEVHHRSHTRCVARILSVKISRRDVHKRFDDCTQRLQSDDDGDKALGTPLGAVSSRRLLSFSSSQPLLAGPLSKPSISSRLWECMQSAVRDNM